jgi:hypothetical protein
MPGFHSCIANRATDKMTATERAAAQLRRMIVVEAVEQSFSLGL